MGIHAETFHANKGYNLAIVVFILTLSYSKQKIVVHFSNAICTKIKPCAPLLCTSTWNISTLSFMWEETNDKVFSPWGLVFPAGPFFRGSVFSQVQGLSPVFRRYHNIYQIIMMMDVTKIMNQTKQNLNRDKWCNMKDCHARNWK